jgi:hypothetical protein
MTDNNSNDNPSNGYKPTFSLTSSETPKNDNQYKLIGQLFARKLWSPRFLLVSGLTVAAGLFTEGILCFVLCSPNVRTFILSFYYLVFAVISIACELQTEFMSKYVRLLLTFSGKGLWYLFLGTIAIGSEWWSVFIAIFLIMLGLLNSYAGCQYGRQYQHQQRQQTKNGELSPPKPHETEFHAVSDDIQIPVELGNIDIDDNNNNNIQRPFAPFPPPPPPKRANANANENGNVSNANGSNPNQDSRPEL